MRLRRGVGTLLTASVLLFAAVTGAAVAPATAAGAATSFPSGSLIIPMDTDTASNHSAFNQNLGMWKAYGLLDRLLRNGVPVSWAIAEGKATTAAIDFSVAGVKDRRTQTALGTWDYRGGPFVISRADAAMALPIISAWWAANGNQPNVHEANAASNPPLTAAKSDVPPLPAPKPDDDAAFLRFPADKFPTAGPKKDRVGANPPPP